MTIKVTKRGEPLAERKYAAKCHSCKSEMQWKHTDAKHVFGGDQRDGAFTQIDCPVCGSTVTGY